MDLELLYRVAGIAVPLCPIALLALIGIPLLLGARISERFVAQSVQATVLVGLGGAVTVLVLMLLTGDRHVPIELGHWIELPEQQFHFHIKLIFDRLSIPFAILTYLLCGTIGAFTSRYLHREPGYNRFYVSYALFMSGMVFATLAGTIELLFFGWELVGLSSALLIAFFHERRNPVRNGMIAWSVYRVADAFFIAGAVLMHHLAGAGDFELLVGEGTWPNAAARTTEAQAVSVGLLLVIAAAGKSALVPFSGWLPRAMEGPTSSSAIFYGALSVHLGAFLLLRISPLLDLSLWLSGTVVGLGLVTAVFATLAGRVQADIKTSLAYASLTQVGIIVAEIGLGFRYLALVHILGHAALRTLQLLRAPTLLHDYHVLENAIDGHLPRAAAPAGRFLPSRMRQWLYLFAMERGFLDEFIDRLVVRPFGRCFRFCDGLERRWTRWLSGRTGRDITEAPPYTDDRYEVGP